MSLRYSLLCGLFFSGNALAGAVVHIDSPENNTVFLHNLKSKLGGKKVNKAEVYELLSLHEGMKKVLCSTSSAHVILPSRQSALLLYQSLTEKDTKLGGGIGKVFQTVTAPVKGVFSRIL